MNRLSRRALFGACAAAGLAAALAAPAAWGVQDAGADLSEIEARLAAFTGVWEIAPPGPPGGRGQRHGAGERPGPGGGFGPPQGRPGFGPESFADRGFGGDRPGFAPAADGPRGGPTGALDESQIPARLQGMEGLDRGDLRAWSEMTAEGRAAFAAQDPHDLPSNNCQSAGLPHIAGAPGLQDWSYKDGVLTIVHDFTPGQTRTIDMTTRVHPNDTHTPEGHAVGWFEGDTLVIETANLAETPAGLARNAPSSDARVVIERYSLSANGDAIQGRMTISDPKFLTRDMSLPTGMSRAEPGTAVTLFPCSVEAAQRHLDF